MGVKGAMFQMIAHGISSAGMFFMVGVIYDRVHHRNLNEFGGLFGKMPVYTALSIGIFFAALGLPGPVRLHRRSARRAVGLEFQQDAGGVGRVGGDPDRRATSCGRFSASTWVRSTGARTPRHCARPHAARTPSPACCSCWPFCWACSRNTFVLQYMEETVDAQVDSLAEWTKEFVPTPPTTAAARRRRCSSC